MAANQHTFTDDKPFTLESGKVLNGLTVVYETFGILNRQQDNAILICHALTGSSQVSGTNGWWSAMVGPKKPIDTDKYFVICSNIIGSCKGSVGPASIDPSTNKLYGLTFPIVTIKDMVNAQYLLVQSLHISCLYAVIGPSMGGMQATLWSILYPDSLKKCIVVASAASLSPQALAFGTVARNAVETDKNFENGKYTATSKPREGLAIARMIGHITYLSKVSITEKFGRKLQEKPDYHYKWGTDFQVESYLQYQGDKFVDQFDANAFLYLSKALSYFDLIKQFGSLKQAFKPVKANVLFISISSDWLYPTELSKEMVAACMNIKKQVSFCEVQSDYGHDAFLIETSKFGQLIKPFLDSDT